MIKVLQIGMSYEIGGTEVFILNHYRAIDRNLFSFDFINFHSDRFFEAEEEIKSLGGNIIPVTNPKKNPMLSCYELKKIIEENNYDIVHLNINSMANIIPFLSTELAHAKRIILHAHNNGITPTFLRITLHSINRLWTEKIHVERYACSKSAGKWMFKNAPFEIFENAIDASKFVFSEEERKETRNHLQIPQEAFVLGNVGRLHYQKNQEFLIKLFAKYLKINQDAYLIIVGEGELRKKLEDLIHAYHIENRVILTGFQKEVRKYYQAMDVFCLPSVFEGLGIVGIEAQMNGLPCVFSDKCVDEVNISGKSQFLPLEEEIWLAVLEELRLQKGKLDRTQQPTKYNLQENIKKLEKIYTNPPEKS